MSYVTSSLLPGEVILYEGRMSLWALQKPLGLGALLLCVCWVLPYWVALATFSVGLLLWVIAAVQFISTERCVTSRRVIAKHGLISRFTSEIELGRVEGLEVVQTTAQRLMGYGTVIVSGVGSHRTSIAAVADPMAFSAAFREALREYGSSSATAGR